MQSVQMAKTRGRQEHPKGRKITPSPEERARVRGLREGKGWTQAELADKAHTTQGTISNLESSDREIFVEVYARILAALKVEAPARGYYDRIVNGASDLNETDQRTVASLVDVLLKAREQKQ